MKTIAVRMFQKKIKKCIDSAQRDRVVVTRRGNPSAVIIGVEGQDWESVVLETNPDFWKLIQHRRNQPTISIEKIRSCFSQ